MYIPLDPLKGSTLIVEPCVHVPIGGDGSPTKEPKEVKTVCDGYSNKALILGYPMVEGETKWRLNGAATCSHLSSYQHNSELTSAK